DVRPDGDAADRRRKHEGEAAALADLLVPRDGVEDAFDREPGDLRTLAQMVDGRGDGVEGGFVQHLTRGRDPGRADQPPAHGLAMGEATVTRDRFEGMAEGVAQVQDAPQPGLALVLLDDLRLDAAGRGDGVLDPDAVPSLERERGLAHGLEEGA